MTGFTEKQRAELRDAVARSRVEAQNESRRLAEEYAKKQRRVQKAVHKTVRAQPVPAAEKPSAFELAGLLAETLTALEMAVADLDSDEISASVFLARSRVTDVGDRLARLRSRNGLKEAGNG